MRVIDKNFVRLARLYLGASFPEFVKIYARIFFNFFQIKKHLDKYIPADGAVFDFGCGYGIFSNYIKLKNPSLDVLGFDISEERIREASKTSHKTGAKFTNEFDDSSLPKKIKLVLLIDVLLFLPIEEKIGLLRKFYSLLEDGGVLFIKDTNKDDSWRFKYTSFEERLKLKFGVYGKGVKAVPYYISENKFVKILTDVGFEIIELMRENFLVYPGIFIVALKPHTLAQKV